MGSRPLSMTSSFLNCLANVSHSGLNCTLGVAPNITTYPGSAPYEAQQAFFNHWIPYINDSVQRAGIGQVPLQVFNSTQALEQAYAIFGNIWAGIVLDSSTYPAHVQVDLRVGASTLPAPILPSQPSLFFPSLSKILGGAGGFDSAGFVLLQTMTDASLANSLTNASLDPFADRLRITADNGGWPDSQLISAWNIIIIPGYLGMAFLGVMFLVVADIVNDRQTKLKEYLKIMGLKESAYWLSNALVMILLLTPVVIIASIAYGVIGTFGAYLPHAIVLIIMFAMSSVAYSLFVASVAPSAEVANGMMTLYTVMPFISAFLINMPLPVRILVSVLVPINYQYTAIELLKKRILLDMAPIRQTPNVILSMGEFPLAAGYSMFVVDMLLYFFLAWYFSQVLGGSDEYGGAPKPWYFLFTKAYWTRKPTFSRKNSKNDPSSMVDDEFDGDMDGASEQTGLLVDHAALVNSDENDHSPSPSSTNGINASHFERFHGNPSDLRIRTRKLVKKYAGADVNAVNGLNLDIFQGIYVLLGENGSGKSTTISMLTGLLPLTSGSAEIDGANVATQLDQVRNSISICPQHDLLSANLTGAQHLRLFGMLKGVPADILEQRIVETLADVGLSDAGDKVPSEYSGGMKRSLSLGISLVAKSRIIFIDEASSGMDMEKRRTLWDMLLRKKREGSTLVLTTHYMEEAEILGDRIGIMNRGNLVREGSLEFLKRELGYQLHSSSPFSKAAASSDAQMEVLPLAQRDQLPDKLKELEAQYEHVAVTTPNLEEVFIQIGKKFDEQNADVDLSYNSLTPAPSEKLLGSMKHAPRPASTGQQLRAFWKKRARAESRNVGNLLCFTLAPILLCVLGLSVSRISAQFISELPKALSVAKATADPVNIGLVHNMPLEIPFVSYNNASSDLLMSWIQPGLTMPYLGNNRTTLDEYLWGATQAIYATQGGVSVPGPYSLGSSRAEYEIEFNATDVYSLPRLVNLVNNMIVQHWVPGLNTRKNVTDPFIRLRSLPFVDTVVSSDSGLLTSLTNNLMILNTQFSYELMTAFVVLAGLMGRRMVEIRENQIISQLERMGMSASKYILAITTFNMARVTVSATLMIAAVACFQVQLLQGPPFLIFALGTYLTAWCIAILTTLISKIFNKSATAQKFFALIMLGLLFIPVLLASFVYALGIIQSKNFQQSPLVSLSNYIMFISPMTILPALLNTMAKAYATSFTTPSLGLLLSVDYSLTPLVFQLVHMLLYTLILFIIEKRAAYIQTTPGDETSSQQLSTLPASDPAAMDSSLIGLDEADLATHDLNSVVLDHIWKRWPGASRRAVVDTSLAIPRGICFGLLGPNGAGKSTTISMMIGDVSPSGGQYSLDGHQAIGSTRDLLYEQVRLACCLQVDSLFPDLTVKEHVELYLSLRNDLEDLDLASTTKAIISRLRLLPHATKLASQLSGGNKRKLCTALAALTYNSIVVLDEPSTGCDPNMRRTLWNVIKTELADKALILTTHSMDEADAVCNRLAIMVNGQIVSLGTPMSLKAKCGGYELRVWLASPEPSAITAFENTVMASNFPGFQLVDQDLTHDNILALKYDIGLLASVSSAFAKLHAAHMAGHLQDYSLTQMTLGTAYQRMVRQQLEDPAPAANGDNKP